MIGLIKLNPTTDVHFRIDRFVQETRFRESPFNNCGREH